MNQTKCYFNRKKYISFTDHDLKDMVFRDKTAKNGKIRTKKEKIIDFSFISKKKIHKNDCVL